MKHNDVHKFVARSEDDLRAHIAACFEAAREPWERGTQHTGDVVELDNELDEPVSVPAAAQRQRKRSLSTVLEAARKAGADRVIVDGVVIVLSPAAVPASTSNEWDVILPEEDHGPN
jgi:hypothetical protein